MRTKRIKTGKKEVYRILKVKPLRYRFHGEVQHKSKRMIQRLGFVGSKVVEVGFIPIKPKGRSK